jgi:hypothetical protein
MVAITRFRLYGGWLRVFGRELEIFNSLLGNLLEPNARSGHATDT